MSKDIIERVKKAVSKTTKTVVRISGEALDYTKLKFKISEINSKLDDKYMAIGLAVYEDNDEAEIEAICEEITSLRTEKDELTLKLNEFKSMKTCPECGKTSDKENLYCPVCGKMF